MLNIPCTFWLVRFRGSSYSRPCHVCQFQHSHDSSEKNVCFQMSSAVGAGLPVRVKFVTSPREICHRSVWSLSPVHEKFVTGSRVFFRRNGSNLQHFYNVWTGPCEAFNESLEPPAGRVSYRWEIMRLCSLADAPWPPREQSNSGWEPLR